MLAGCQLASLGRKARKQGWSLSSVTPGQGAVLEQVPSLPCSQFPYLQKELNYIISKGPSGTQVFSQGQQSGAHPTGPSNWDMVLGERSSPYSKEGISEHQRPACCRRSILGSLMGPKWKTVKWTTFRNADFNKTRLGQAHSA